MDSVQAYDRLRDIERQLHDLACAIIQDPGQQVMLLAVRSADGESVSLRAQITIPGCSDPYMHTVMNDGYEELTWKSGHIRPEQLRFSDIPVGCERIKK